MKIIFNHNINENNIQLFDEFKRNYEVILPKNYLETNSYKEVVDLEALEKAARENPDADLIYGFQGDLSHLIKWKEKKIDIPLIIANWNIINRPFRARMSALDNVLYVEKYAELLMNKYKIENIIYQGMAANQYIFHPIYKKKKYDVEFIGRHYGERGYWLNKVKNFCEREKINYIFPFGHGLEMKWSYESINKLYNETKINLSFAPLEPYGRIVNLRTFEICMAGAFQLMQYTPAVKEFFEIDKEIVCWNNKKELFEKIQYYLENEKEREKIAKNGYKRAFKNHTWTVRMEEMLEFVKNKKKREIQKYIIKVDYILSNNKSQSIQNLLSVSLNNRNLDFVKNILRLYGYRPKRHFKKKDKLIIDLNQRDWLIYKPNLKNFLFYEYFGKTLIVILVKKNLKSLILTDWENLEKILYLSDNIDITVPNFGILTNGNDWIIRDFHSRKWLKNIPSRKAIKARNEQSKYIIIKLLKSIQYYYRKVNLNRLFKIIKIKRYLIITTDLFKKFFPILNRKLIFS